MGVATDLCCLLWQVMMGGKWFEELFGSPDTVDKEALKQIALEELACHIGISVEPVECLINVHKVFDTFVCSHCTG